MNHSTTVMLRWGWLLGVSLFGPVALPAGGAERRLPQIRRQQGKGPLLSGSNCLLHSSPLVAAPALRRLEIGTPLQLLRRWRSEDGSDWIQVQVASGSGLSASVEQQRGWIHH